MPCYCTTVATIVNVAVDVNIVVVLTTGVAATVFLAATTADVAATATTATDHFLVTAAVLILGTSSLSLNVFRGMVLALWASNSFQFILFFIFIIS